MTESTNAPTYVVRLRDDTSGVATDATYERVGDAVRLRTVTFSHPVEVTSVDLARFPINLARAEAEKALLR